jgi:hypothetical protein
MPSQSELITHASPNHPPEGLLDKPRKQGRQTQESSRRGLGHGLRGKEGDSPPQVIPHRLHNMSRECGFSKRHAHEEGDDCGSDERSCSDGGLLKPSN